MVDVPKALGVPSLAAFAIEPLILLVADLVFPSIALFGPQWGIFLDGAPALEPNSIVGLDYRQDWSIADYQVEEGAFQSYDKVQLPADLRIRIASEGTQAGRSELLNEALIVANSLDLYDIVTPDRIYTSYNPSHLDFHQRADSGVGMIVIDIWFQEIRVEATAAFSNTAQPSEAGQQNSGNVQAQPAPANIFTPNLSFT